MLSANWVGASVELPVHGRNVDHVHGLQRGGIEEDPRVRAVQHQLALLVFFAELRAAGREEGHVQFQFVDERVGRRVRRHHEMPGHVGAVGVIGVEAEHGLHAGQPQAFRVVEVQRSGLLERGQRLFQRFRRQCMFEARRRVGFGRGRGRLRIVPLAAGESGAAQQAAHRDEQGSPADLAGRGVGHGCCFSMLGWPVGLHRILARESCRIKPAYR